MSDLKTLPETQDPSPYVLTTLLIDVVIIVSHFLDRQDLLPPGH